MVKVTPRSAFPGDKDCALWGAASCALAALLLVSLLPARTAWAQQAGAITGTVTDSQSGDPIPGVNVVIEATQRGASTDAEQEIELNPNLEQNPPLG